MGCKQIKAMLDQVYGVGVAYSLDAVKYWIREWKSGRTSAEDEHRIGRPEIELSDIIASFLSDEPYASTKAIAKALHVTKETIKRNLKHNLGYMKYSSKWIPHTLTDDLKRQRVETSIELLRILENDRVNGFENICSGDESWFRMQYFHSAQWAPNRESVAQRVLPNIQTKKRMFTIFFTGISCICINMLPQGMKYNATYFCDTILEEIRENGRRGSRKKTLKKMFIHMDNARVHNSIKSMAKISELQMQRAPHPPYSPDISLLDFWFFGYAKNLLAGRKFEDAADLEAAIQQIAESVSKSELQRVFESWIRRLRAVIESGGEYFIK
jgi:hypothetical protein